MKIEQHKDQTLRPMTTVLRRLLVFCAILVGAGLASAQAPLQKLSVSMSSTGMPSIELYIARDKGFFREEGFEPQLIRMSANAAIAAGVAGELDALGSVGSAVRGIMRGVPLRIAAKVDAVDREYFETTIRPLLAHPLIEFLGEVDERQKRALLRDTLALLFPIDWPEPFGLVMIEALACGTPVIARPRGAVAEVLRDGITGWLCETEDAMVKAVGRVAGLKRATCRQEFDHRFTTRTMTQRYLQVYQESIEATDFRRRHHESESGVASSFSPSPAASTLNGTDRRGVV